MKDFRVIICGSRNFDDYKLLQEFCDSCLSEKRKTARIIIVSGMAKGADTLAVQYANENGFQVHKVFADWETHGRSAGYKRNTEMSKVADACIAFQINNSAGTQHMIETMRELNKPVKVKSLNARSA